MSDEPDMKGEELDLFAAEYALGLLSAPDLTHAERLFAADEDFKKSVARWSGRLAPLLEEVEIASPPPGLWARIESRIGPLEGPATAPAETASNVHVLRREVALWRAYSIAATALAASLALFLVARPTPVPPTLLPAPAPLVAMMEAEGSQAKLVATYDPASRVLLVTPAAGIQAVPDHAHELWIIPADGKPRPMGLLKPGAPRRMAVPSHMLGEMKAEVILAVSVEPAGGSPTGQPTGPVVAAGKLLPA